MKKQAANRQKLKKQRSALAKGLGRSGRLLKGSVIEKGIKCSKPQCECTRGKLHGPYLYVSVFCGKEAGTRLIYVPKHMHKEVKAWVGNLHRIREDIEMINQVNLNLLKLEKNRKNRN